MRVAGDLYTKRDLRYGWALRSPVTDKGSGSVVLTVDDTGEYLIVRGTGASQTITLPDGSLPGRHIELYNAGTFSMQIIPVGNDTLLPVGQDTIDPGERVKVENTATDEWYISESGQQLRVLQELHHYSRTVDHSTTSHQTLGNAAGDPPTAASATAIDFSVSTLNLDNGFLDDEANDQIVIQHDGKYRVTASLEVQVISGDEVFAYVVQDGTTALAVTAAEVPNNDTKIVTVEWTGDLSDGDAIGIRATSGTNPADVHGYEITVEQLSDSMAQSAPPADPAYYVYYTPTAQTLDAALPVNKAIPFNVLQDSFGTGCANDGNGVITLESGVWLLRGGVQFGYGQIGGPLVTSGTVNYGWQDVTDAIDAVNDAGTAIGKFQTSIALHFTNANTQAASFCPVIVRVPKGGTRKYKLAILSKNQLYNILANNVGVLHVERLAP